MRVVAWQIHMRVVAWQIHMRVVAWQIHMRVVAWQIRSVGDGSLNQIGNSTFAGCVARAQIFSIRRFASRQIVGNLLRGGVGVLRIAQKLLIRLLFTVESLCDVLLLQTINNGA